MTEPTRRALFAAPLLLAGCGDSEADQRRAFIAFLNEQVLATPGVRVPRPDDKQAAKWGAYSAQYGIIADFHDALADRVLGPLQQILQRVAPLAPYELVDKQTYLLSLQNVVDGLPAELERELANAEARRASLKQADDLRPVFDAAYQRNVTAQANALRLLLPVTKRSFGADLDLAGFLAEHRSGVAVQGTGLQATDPALETELAAKVRAAEEASQALREARAQYEAVLADVQ